MKKYLHLIIVLICTDIYCQTGKLELENLSARYSRGEFTQAEYIQLARDWNELLKSFGEYPKLPYNENIKAIEFKSIISFNDIDKKSIYDRTMEWAAETFGSLASVLHYSNPESGKIILKGWFNVVYKSDIETFFTSKKEKISSVKCNFTSVFTIKDNKEKIEVINIEYEYLIPGYISGNLYIPETTFNNDISSLYPITNGESILWKGRLDLMNQTNIRITYYFKDLEKYISNKAADYNF